MKMELYLRKINQEMIDAGRQPVKGAAPEWVISWPKECCIADFSRVKPDDIELHPPTRGLIMREEDGGGMFWDPRTGSVYKVDEEAYHAMLELDSGSSEIEVAKRLRVSRKDVRSFVEELRGILD